MIIPHYPEMTAAAHQASLIILNACAPSDQGTSYPQQAPARAISHIQHWSGWRRCHQGHARHSHYQHRLATELGP